MQEKKARYSKKRKPARKSSIGRPWICSRQGYYGISSTMLIAKTGRSKGGFYHYFKSKEELFLELFQTNAGHLTTNAMARIESGSSVQEAFAAAMAGAGKSLKARDNLKAAGNCIFSHCRNPKVLNVIRAFMGNRGVRGPAAGDRETTRRTGVFRTGVGPGRDDSTTAIAAYFLWK